MSHSARPLPAALSAAPSETVASRGSGGIASTVLVTLLIALIVRTLAFQPFTIPSSSMEPGLVIGDYIVVSKFPYGWSRASAPLNLPLFKGRLFSRSPARGDVVVFRHPARPKETLVKRVIGLPGDQVEIRRGAVFINGLPIRQTPLDRVRDHDEPERVVQQVSETQPEGAAYLTYDRGEGGPGDDTGVHVVPPGHYFVMGDNRDNSLDSRWSRPEGVGLLPEENIIGRVEIVLASWRPGASLFKPWTWLTLQPERFLKRVG